MKALYIGGSKSGKSMASQRLCKELSGGKDLYYWATMIPSDDEDLIRIKHHLEDREGWGFETIECGVDLPTAFHKVDANSTILFDSITAVLSNEMFRMEKVKTENGEETKFSFDEKAPGRLLSDLIVLSNRVKNIVCVCDYIFADGLEYDDWTGRYLKGQADICRGLVPHFDRVVEMTAGAANYWKG